MAMRVWLWSIYSAALSFLKMLGRQKDKQNIQGCIISPEKTPEKCQPVKFLSQLKLLSFLKGRRLDKH